MATQNVAMTAAPVPQSDLNVDEAGLQRRMAMAQLLQQQAMSAPPNETVSGMMVKQSPLQGLARLLQAYGASKMTDQVDADQRRLVSQQQQAIASALREQDPTKSAMLMLSSSDPTVKAEGLKLALQEKQRQQWAKELFPDQSSASVGPQGIPAPAPFGNQPPASVGAAPQSMQPVPGFTVHGVPLDQAKLALQQDASGKQYFELVHKLREPKMSQDGKVLTYQNMGNTWGYAPAPGSVAAIKQFGQAGEDVKNENEFVDVPQSDGTSVKVKKQEYLDYRNGKGKAPAVADMQGDPREILKAIAAIPDAKERDAALKAYTNNNQIGASGVISPQPKLGVTQSPAQAEAAKIAAKEAAEKKNERIDAEGSMPQLEKTVSQLKELGKDATYTMVGKARDTVARQLGLVTEGAVAREKYIQTVRDVLFPQLRATFGAQFTVKEGEALVATLGDPDKSPQERNAALDAFIDQKKQHLETLKRQEGMKGGSPSTQPAAQPAAQKTVVRTGKSNGRKVVQYSDGSIDYAD